MRKYIPSILTKEIKKFYIVPTIGIDWDPGVSYNIGIYAGTVSFQLEWNYGPPSLKLNDLNILESDLILSDFEELMVDTSKRDNEPNDKLLNVRDRYMERTMRDTYLDEYEVYLYNCDKSKVLPISFEKFIHSKLMTNSVEKKIGKLDTSWLDYIREGDELWSNKKYE
tara:strand:+ start:2420 stop:2923 length:504 start_codon:yes stop_codon:yes gene_type:complete